MTNRSTHTEFSRLTTIIAMVLVLCLTGAPLEGRGAEPEAGTARLRPVRFGPISSWLRENGIRLDRVEGVGSTTDLLPLSPWIGNAEIIGLGDGTHGTHEYYTFKHRMIQFFAEAGIARTFVFEGPWPEFLRIDDYIHGGEGNPRELLKTEYFFFWEFEEMIDLIVWAREFNATRPPDEQIDLLGFDVVTAETRDAADLVINYLGEVDAAARSTAVNSYQCVPDRIATSACGQSAASVRDAIEAKRETYEAASSPRAYQRALQSARVVASSSEFITAKPGDQEAGRDVQLAKHVQWFSETWTEDERLVVLAHNEHIGTLPVVGQWKSLGQHLDELYGDRYFKIGTCMLSGSLARYINMGVSVAEMEPPLETNYELQFAKSGYRAFVIPLFLPDNPAWLTGPANLRFATASYPKPALLEYHNPSYSLPDKFDAIVFIKETTPCTPLDSAGTKRRPHQSFSSLSE